MRTAYSETAVASRYNSARSLPAETILLWMEILKSSIPASAIHRVLDLGCGTGRFTQALAETFCCAAIGVEPSTAMLEVAMSRPDADVEWKEGSANSIPLEDRSVDLVFMSQVFHHLPNRQQALAEIFRVLSSVGYLVLRNGTREHNHELEWLRFFPAAYQMEEQRTPYAREVSQTISAGNFVSISHQTVRQLFASSYADYFNKISCRGLSALISISDEEFQQGVEEFKNWVDHQPTDTAVYEPIDVFIFSKEVNCPIVNRTRSTKHPLPFAFVIEELSGLRPVVKSAFGFTYVYLDDRLLFTLRDSVKQPATNGMWLFTSSEHADSLAKEFPDLSRRQIWRSGKNCWIVLASRLEYFEEYALKACELILNGDRRIGRLSRRSLGVRRPGAAVANDWASDIFN